MAEQDQMYLNNKRFLVDSSTGEVVVNPELNGGKLLVKDDANNDVISSDPSTGETTIKTVKSDSIVPETPGGEVVINNTTITEEGVETSELTLIDTEDDNTLTMILDEALAADRILNLTTGDSDRTLDILGDSVIDQDLSTNSTTAQFVDLNITGSLTTANFDIGGSLLVEDTFALQNAAGDIFTSDPQRRTQFYDGQLNAQAPASLTLHANYNTASDPDLNISSGSATGTLVGSATVSGGRLNLNNDDQAYVTYDGTSNCDSPQVGHVV